MNRSYLVKILISQKIQVGIKNLYIIGSCKTDNLIKEVVDSIYESVISSNSIRIGNNEYLLENEYFNLIGLKNIKSRISVLVSYEFESNKQQREC